MILDIPAFVRANTRVLSPPHVPELKLHLADDAVRLWELTEKQLGEIGLPPPFWAFAWAGGQALARYLLDNPSVARDQNVFDIASGSGIVAIAAMQAGARRALCIDIDAFATAAANLNAELNGVAVEAHTGDAMSKGQACDLICAGDLFYERDLAASVLKSLQEFQAAGKTVLIGDPGRSYFPKERFEQLATYDVAVTRAIEDSDIKRTSVWRLK